MQGFISSEVIANCHGMVATLDFTRCVRPDGSAYGTSGKCRKGVESPLKGETAQMIALYKKLGDIKNNMGLPSAEVDWRAPEVENEIHRLRKQVLEKASTLGAKGQKALEAFNKAEFEAKASSRTQKELKREIDNLHYDIVTYRGDKAEKGRVKEIAFQMRTLSKYLKDEVERSKALYEVDRLTGKTKDHKPGGPRETLRAGREFLAQYDEGLRSTLSILRKANALEATLREMSAKEKEEKKPGWLKRKMRISAAIMNAAQKRGNAEARLQAKMASIRNELLKTKLSDEEVSTLVGRVSLTGSTKEVRAQAKQHLEEFARMFNGKGLIQVQEGDFRVTQLGTVVMDPNKRAHAFPTSGWLTTNGPKQTMFHEVGHIVEGQRPWLIQYAERWRDSRAFSLAKARRDPEAQKLVGDGKTAAVPHTDVTLSTGKSGPIFRLTEMLPLQGRYDSHEVAVVDRFMTPYVGKRYSDGLTEVVSSTLEHFAEPHLMAHLYKNHPDLFLLGVGLART